MGSLQPLTNCPFTVASDDTHHHVTITGRYFLVACSVYYLNGVTSIGLAARRSNLHAFSSATDDDSNFLGPDLSDLKTPSRLKAAR
jgi:hypothetical protein